MTKQIVQFLKEWVLPIVTAIIIVSLIRSFVFTFVRVSGDSMQPNLQDREFVGVSKVSKYKRGDVVVFDARHEDPRIRTGEKDYVKRIIGVGGDTVSYKNSDLYVNGKIINQNFIGINERTQGTEMSFGSEWSLKTLSANRAWQAKDRNHTTVPKGTYFVMGDHRSVSNDGRYFGFIDKSSISGKVVVPFWNTNKTAKANINQHNKHFFDK